MSRAASPVANRLAIKRLGLWLFLLSEGTLFLALLVIRFYLQGVHRPTELNQPLGFIISGILLLSSLTAYRAETAIACGEEKPFRRNILFTIGLGSLFLVGVGLEWAEGFRFFPPANGFGTVFFTLTGFHAFHVLTGLLALLTLVWPGQPGHFTPENYWAVEGIVKYWHFVDVAWLFIFPTLYLVS
ncbi:MAG: heme-copper oxidase subunit III [Chloroflexi bacterium]|nr:heme-copper oxidase subunit III [Chloroflexota bacterium]